MNLLTSSLLANVAQPMFVMSTCSTLGLCDRNKFNRGLAELKKLWCIA